VSYLWEESSQGAAQRNRAKFVAISQIRFQFSSLLLFLFSQDLPADSTDAGFETQSANDLSEQYVLPAGAGQNGLHLNFVGT
jgi:hypothetical protein